MLAISRQRSIISGVFCNAMMKAPTEYHSSAKVKMERRPKRSESQLKTSVPMNIPAKQRCDETGEAVQIEQALRRRGEQAFLEKTDRNVGGEEQIVEFKPAAERQECYEVARVAQGRQAIETRRYRDRCIGSHVVPPPTRPSRDRAEL